MHISRDLFDKREDYSKFILSESDLRANPIAQFDFWFRAVEKEISDEANAMVLSTADLEGSVSSRMVLLKKYSEAGFVFFTNYKSRKGQQITKNPTVSLLFYWSAFQRQVRIEGTIEKISEQESDSYFYSRPIDSQISAIVSPQSEKIYSRHFLDDLAQKEHEKEAHQRPKHWGGFMVLPSYFEFWQGRSNRLHDRIAYSKQGADWVYSRLAP